MNKHYRREDIHPWYRQVWPWILILLPASAVIASLVTIYIAVRQPTAMVADDYYKKGLAINRVLKQQRTAAQLKLQADGNLTGQRDIVILNLSGDLSAFPPLLELSLIHPTLANQDRTVLLSHENQGRYRAQIAQPFSGTRMVQLAPPDETWRLDARVDFDEQLNWVLKPAI